MNDRNLSEDDLFRMIDISDDGLIQLSEMEQVLKIFDEFRIKELHSLYNFFDIDNNGVIDKSEFYGQMKKARSRYNKNHK